MIVVKNDSGTVRRAVAILEIDDAALSVAGNTATIDIAGGSGDVTGPASSTDNAIPRFNGAGGKTLQGSGVTIDDGDNIVSPGDVSDATGSLASVRSQSTTNATDIADHETRVAALESDISSATIDQEVATKTDTWTVTAADRGYLFFLSAATAKSQSLADSIAAGVSFTVFNQNAGAWTFSATTGTLSDVAGTTGSVVINRGEGLTFLSLGSNNWQCSKTRYERSLGKLTIEEPTGSEDLSLCYVPNSVVITRQVVVLTGSVSSWTADVHHGTDRSAAGTALITTPSASTSTTTGTIVTSFDNPTVAAASFIWVESDAVAGSSGTAMIELFGYDA